jgi:hypothetical protein
VALTGRARRAKREKGEAWSDWDWLAAWLGQKAEGGWSHASLGFPFLFWILNPFPFYFPFWTQNQNMPQIQK